ncbi:MAG: GNAT family N-acetyltransferase [Gammaproteobacteria bacterium]|nr:GNAT family N-acetyltransferase [Gammaproteobacteria bacterium]
MFESFDELPGGHRELLKAAGADVYALSPGWFSNFAATVLQPGDTLRIVTVTAPDGTALALLPLYKRRGDRRKGHGELASLANFYTCEFDVISGRNGEDPQAIADSLCSAIAAQRPRPDIVRIDSLPECGMWLAPLLRGFRKAGFLVEPFEYFGCWFESLQNKTMADYMASRPGRLRSTVTRKRRRMERYGDARVVIASALEDAKLLIADYEEVHAKSWKPAEPHPDFMPGLIHVAARDGALRLGVLYRAERPIAAQLWLLSGTRATIYKLSYDSAHGRDSPGAVLTLYMIEHAVAEGSLTELDFGRGDDPYKREWLKERRARWSLIAMNPRTANGALCALRRMTKHWAKRVLGRVWPV